MGNSGRASVAAWLVRLMLNRSPRLEAKPSQTFQAAGRPIANQVASNANASRVSQIRPRRVVESSTTIAGAHGSASSAPLNSPAWASRPSRIANKAPPSPIHLSRFHTAGCNIVAGKSPLSDLSAGRQTSRKKGICPAIRASDANKSHLEKKALPGRLALEVCWTGWVVEATPAPMLKVKAPSVWCPSVAETAFQLTV